MSEKFAIMLGATLLGVLIGWFPSPKRPRPPWWKLVVIASMVAMIFLGIYPPIAGTFTDVVMATRMDGTKVVPVLVSNVVKSTTGITANDARDARIAVTLVDTANLLSALTQNNEAVVHVRRADSTDVRFVVERLSSVDPAVTLPYIIGLEERARLIFFHVPLSWVGSIAYLLSMIFAIRYLRSRNIEWDTYSMAAASVATLYAFLATVTGSIWAKFNWGEFWNWDPRETSIFLLLMVYGAYFLLRSTIDDPEKRARLSATYSIVAFVTVPFLVYVLPRLLPGLHPGSADDVNAGPLLSPKSDAINFTKTVVFGLSLFAFTLAYFWLYSIRIRVSNILIFNKSKHHD